MKAFSIVYANEDSTPLMLQVTSNRFQTSFHQRAPSSRAYVESLANARSIRDKKSDLSGDGLGESMIYEEVMLNEGM